MPVCFCVGGFSTAVKHWCDTAGQKIELAAAAGRFYCDTGNAAEQPLASTRFTSSDSAHYFSEPAYAGTTQKND